MNARLLLGVNDNIAAVARVLAHLQEFVWRERAGFVKNLIGHADLADVV